MSKAKTFHVDFAASRKVTKVEEVEYEGSRVSNLGSLSEFMAEAKRVSESNGPTVSSHPVTTPSSGIVVDPAAYLRSVIEKFEGHLDACGAFDESLYTNPNVRFDAFNTYHTLKSEIEQLKCTMDNLREMLMADGGSDPESKR